MSAPPSPATAVVTLTIPADARFLRVARLVAAGLAADADLTVDEIDDLRVAVDEVGAALLEPEGDPTIELEFESGPDRLDVRARRGGVTTLPDLHPVSRALLDATTDGFDLRLDAGRLLVDAWRRRAPRS